MHIKEHSRASVLSQDQQTVMKLERECTRKNTILGKTIPFTETEWNKLSKKMKEAIKSLL